MRSGVHRKRLACVECTRRKVKCDKILPCRNCSRKGTACTRPRDRSSPVSSIAVIGRHEETFTSPTAGALDIIQRLESQVNQLEAALEDSRARETQQPTPTVRSTSTPRLPTTSSPTAVKTSTLDPENSIGEVEDAATILEFLAWGRRKDPTYHDAIIQNSKPDHSPGDVTVEDEVDYAHSPGYMPSSICQMLLPTQPKVLQLIKYHMDCLLWYHGALHATTFMKELVKFYDQYDGQIDSRGVDLQWIALLFAILTGSMTCAPRSVAQSWGFHGEEQETLSKRWLKATTTCLQRAEYMAYHSIYSVQAIATLTISAHMLGYSNGLSVLLASAVRIAQGLGLHEMKEDQEATQTAENILSREIGRRVWCQLCIQDWFSIPFTESYLLHQGFTTSKPQNSDDDMNPLPEHTPTVTSYSRLFYDIAALMPNLQDAITTSNTPYTKYEQVLKYDRKMRTLATKHLPYYLQNVPLDPGWPCYVPWARRSLAISSAHKVIMIHRKFLSASFSNPMFELTRKTCVAASRTIIKEQMEAVRDGGPVLWIHQAFSVTASIILCLDLFHQSGPERESSEHRRLINGGIEILSQCQSDMIAKRGVSLLKAMLADDQCKTSERRLTVEMHGRRDIHNDMPGAQRSNFLSIPAIIRNFYQQDHAPLVGKPRRTSETSEVGRWPELMRDDPVATPGVDFLASLGLDCVGGLDEILNMATDYMN
ncbi:hypothetical protein PENANT_c001G08466 [Penicillium antarcticum]|uniref:Zn(2)-C6 fungal-type domain-containing protein n=1 Tax=Penicillium antarcticum TaxID=416450 RepID=A0A1V6QNP8_9EURO|nr:uncharacterized protein N7508_010290 [Penicillium antarcticum]KAJ5295469.1 hypothetical protein N7508_010290 [Penicillium antarcticum]OQD90859.1 hypothetical protein PENANT_c001G08466 [Penicillium antarcticum]